MSFPGETNPLSTNKTHDPDSNREIGKTHDKKEGSLHGRKASHIEDAQSKSTVAHKIITDSNLPETEPSSTEMIKGITLGDAKINISMPEKKTVKEKIDELVFRIEDVWYSANDEETNKVSPPDYSQFLSEELLFDSLGKFLVANRSEFSTKDKISDFLMEFAVAFKREDKDTLIRVAKQLIDTNNPTTYAFLYLCKDTSAFNTIVRTILSRDAAFEFISHYATHNEARNAIITVLKNRKETLPVFFYTTNNRSFNERELLSIGREIGELDLFKRFIEATKSDTDPHLITHFFNFPTKLNEDEISNVLKFKLPITHEMLCACITTRNYSGIEKLLDTCEKQFIVDAKEKIFKIMMLYRDPMLGALISKHAPYLIEMISRENLDDAASDGNDWFFEWAISNGLAITAQEADEILPVAVAAGNLSLVKLLFNTTSDDGIHPLYSYPDGLEMDKVTKPEKIQHILMHFAIHSPLEEIYAFASKYPDWADILEKTIRLLPLMVRFPNMQFTQAIGYDQMSIANYENGSVEYAQENREITDHLLTKIQNSRETLLEEIIQNRFKRLPINAPETIEAKKVRYRYKELRRSDAYSHLGHKTPFYLTINNFGMAEMPVIIDVHPIRYSWCLKHLNKLCTDSETKEWGVPPNTSMEIEELTDMNGNYENRINFTYTYSREDGSEVVLPMTSLQPQIMDHTPHATLNKIQDHIETLHKEIVSYQLDFTNPENLKLFYEKVARGYWLIATLCETNRGTPHNAMIWLNLMYDHHKLPPPIPKIDHFFLDNTMLVTPVEIAIENWESYFEPTLDVALKNTYGKESVKVLYRLLRKNGDLLKLCSPEVRDNDKLVIRATTTTPSAIQYASKRLQNDSKSIHNL